MDHKMPRTAMYTLHYTVLCVPVLYMTVFFFAWCTYQYKQVVRHRTVQSKDKIEMIRQTKRILCHNCRQFRQRPDYHARLFVRSRALPPVIGIRLLKSEIQKIQDSLLVATLRATHSVPAHSTAWLLTFLGSSLTCQFCDASLGMQHFKG